MIKLHPSPYLTLVRPMGSSSLQPTARLDILRPYPRPLNEENVAPPRRSGTSLSLSGSPPHPERAVTSDRHFF